MSSNLNPEAPEFSPRLQTHVQTGFTTANKTIKCANTFPIGSSYDFFKTFTDFGVITSSLREFIVTQCNKIMSTQGSSVKLKCEDYDADEENNTEKIIDANDTILDQININIDLLSGVNKPSDDFMKGMSAAWNREPVIATVKVGSTTFLGATNIERPQLLFKDQIDNNSGLWHPKIKDKPNNIKPLALNYICDENGVPVEFEHPYQVELDLYAPPVELLADSEPQVPPTPEETPLHLVNTLDQLQELINHLDQQTEFAVDLEHHSYRSYQGFTCLIQISTDSGGDYLVDTLALREHIHKLNSSFTNPKIIKVFHGAQNDILWLQRDFGVYVVGLFDTFVAAKLLKQVGLSLKNVLLRYCNITVDKKYQLADWRIRPLPSELQYYARVDTHYLLYVWRRMRRDLLTAGSNALLLQAFEDSKTVCAARYKIEAMTETSHLPLYYQSKKSFSTRQLAALGELYRWRDEHARDVDESGPYLIPNHMLLTLAELLPRDAQGVMACCSPPTPFLRQHVNRVRDIIATCREMGATERPHHLAPVMRPTPILNWPIHDHSQQQLIQYDNIDISIIIEDEYNKETETVAIVPIQHFQGNKLIKPNGKYEVNTALQLFVPPYDRYKLYCALRQEEVRNSKACELVPVIKEEPLTKPAVATTKVSASSGPTTPSTQNNPNVTRKRKSKDDFKSTENITKKNKKMLLSVT